MCPSDPDRKWYAFKTFTNITLGPFDTYREAKEGIAEEIKSCQ